MPYIIVFKAGLTLSNPGFRVISLAPYLGRKGMLLNIAAFVSFGIICRFFLKKNSLCIIFYGFRLRFFYEEHQYILVLGTRAINDLVTNSLEAAIGTSVFYVFRKKIP